MHHARRHNEQRRGGNGVRYILGAHLATTVENHQELVQIAMRMRADLPIVEPAAGRNGLDVHEALVGVPRRFAIQEEAGHGGRSGHLPDYRLRPRKKSKWIEPVCMESRLGRQDAAGRMRTQVAIIGAGPAGLLLAQLLHLRGIDSVVLELKSREYIENRVRAGVLENVSVDVLNAAGVGERLMREGLRHEGVHIHFAGRDLRIDFHALTGRAVTVYGQQEVVKDLVAARLATGRPLLFEVDEVTVHNLDSETPEVRFRDHSGADTVLQCDFIAGCDGFHGICRQSFPPSVLKLFERVYPYAWLGILAESQPASEEIIYANHDHGFALLSMRSPTISRLYLQCAPDERLEEWPDERIWNELETRLATREGFTLPRGPVLQKGVTPMRSFVAEPMQYGRLFLAGDAAHIVPPTGAKGMNSAVADVVVLADALGHYYDSARGSVRLEKLNAYSEKCLRRVWKVQRFSWWVTQLVHRSDADNDFDRRRQLAELDYLSSSKAAELTFAENYVGLPIG